MGESLWRAATQEQVRTGLLPRAMASVTETTTISYSYDPLYRLTGASYTGVLTNTFGYTYDAVGNRLTQTASGAVISYTYDIANRLTTVNGVTYSWDDNGNLLNDGMQTYTYDQANRLKQATQGGTTTTFGYNGVGDRLSQTVGVTTTHYVLDPAAGLTQVLADGTNTYLYGNDRLAQYQGGMQYFGADGLGSVRQIFDASAVVVGSTRYDPFGNVMSQGGTATSAFAFAGEQYDATALTYLRARYYSAAQGRFLTRDVAILEYENLQAINRYTYGLDNPVRYRDPTGRWVCGDAEWSQAYSDSHGGQAPDANALADCRTAASLGGGLDWGDADWVGLYNARQAGFDNWLNRGVTFTGKWRGLQVFEATTALNLMEKALNGKVASGLRLATGLALEGRQGTGVGGGSFGDSPIFMYMNTDPGQFEYTAYTWLHEFGHIVDRSAGVNSSVGGQPVKDCDNVWLKNVPGWSKEWFGLGSWSYAGNTGYVRPYSRTSPAEDFADTLAWYAFTASNRPLPVDLLSGQPMNAPNQNRRDALRIVLDQLR